MAGRGGSEEERREKGGKRGERRDKNLRENHG